MSSVWYPISLKYLNFRRTACCFKISERVNFVMMFIFAQTSPNSQLGTVRFKNSEQSTESKKNYVYARNLKYHNATIYPSQSVWGEDYYEKSHGFLFENTHFILKYFPLSTGLWILGIYCNFLIFRLRGRRKWNKLFDNNGSSELIRFEYLHRHMITELYLW